MRFSDSSSKKSIAHAARCVLAILALGSVSCASQPPSAAYNAAPTYPITKIRLHGGLSLEHKAGPECHDESRPDIGVTDGMRTYSIYELRDSLGNKVCEIPSGLSDPEDAGIDFKSYYRENDKLSVFQSASGHTVLIVEDRSPTFPRIALLLVKQSENGDWTPSQISAPYLKPVRNRQHYPIFGSYPTVVGISDSKVTFEFGSKRWSEHFTKLPAPAAS